MTNKKKTQDTSPRQKVLLVDDDPVVRLLVEDCLQKEGYEVTLCENGKSCLEALDHGDKPDILLLDVIMPEMNGFQVLEHMKNTPELSSVPVVLLSANTSTESTPLDGSLKSEHFLQKPFHMKEILNIVRTCLDERKS
jgi:CheY-like chemotaxis protein